MKRTIKEFGRIWIVFLCMIAVLLVGGCDQEDPETLAEERLRQETWKETLLEYGYPAIVIDEMDPVCKEQICRDRVYFHSAEIRYVQRDSTTGDRVLYYTGPSAHVGYPEVKEEEQEYDICYMLVAGVCYADGTSEGELDHVLCSFHYRWNTLPKDREEDKLQITWDGDLLWSVDDSFGRSWSQITNEGRREGLGAEFRASALSKGSAQWYTRMKDLDRWGIQGMAGAVWVQLKPLDGVDLTKEWPALRGSYIYEEKNKWFHMSQNYDALLDLRFFDGGKIYEGN